LLLHEAVDGCEERARAGDGPKPGHSSREQAYAVGGEGDMRASRPEAIT